MFPRSNVLCTRAQSLDCTLTSLCVTVCTFHTQTLTHTHSTSLSTSLSLSLDLSLDLSTSLVCLQYCPIPLVSYPQLEHELFCGMYYLRHLCDEQRFPDWPIQNHVEVRCACVVAVLWLFCSFTPLHSISLHSTPLTGLRLALLVLQLLKEILEAWKLECEKKPQTMSVDEAYETLGLEPGAKYDQRKVCHRSNCSSCCPPCCPSCFPPCSPPCCPSCCPPCSPPCSS